MEDQTQSQATNNKISKVYYPLLLFSVLLYSVYTLGLLQHSVRLLIYPFAVDYVEWPEISRAVQLLEGRTIYSSWDEFPLRVANYPPLFTFAHAIGIWFTSPTPLIGRLIALLSTMGIMILIGSIVKNHTLAKGKWIVIPVLSGLLYASSHMTWLWSSIVRVDNVAILLSLGAIYLYTIPKEHVWNSKIAMILCALALFTKQTMWAAPLSILIHTWISEREFLKERTVYFGSTIVSLYSLLMLLTGGLAYNHLIIANMNPFDWDMFFAFWRDFWILYHWTLPLIAVGIFILRKSLVLLLYACFAFIFSISIAKVGSSLNYVLELWSIVCIFIGAALSFPTQKTSSQNLLTPIFLIGVLLYGWQNMFHVPWERQRVGNQKMKAMALGSWNDIATYSTYIPFYILNPYANSPVDIIKRNVRLYTPTPAQWELDMMFDIDDYIQKNMKQPILSEDMNFYHLSKNQDIMLQSFEMLQLSRQRIFDEDILHVCLRTQRDCLPTLVLMFDVNSDNINYVSKQRFGLQTIQIIKENYIPEAQLGPYYIYAKR